MQIMTEKGTLVRDESQRRHVYRPARSRQTTLRSLVSGLLKLAFDGSAAELVQGAISAKPPTKRELAEIRRILDEHERRRS
jgi:predicted transcriptional regulator